MIPRKTIFSPDRVYRYTLWRNWSAVTINREYACFIGLNPSTADEVQDDPTVRRCIRFAQRWGYGALCMLNIFAYRSTDPNGLRGISDPVGPENDRYIRECTSEAGIVICAWGNWGEYRDRGIEVMNQIQMYQPIFCLGENVNGQPKHPLYTKSDAQAIPFRGKICQK